MFNMVFSATSFIVIIRPGIRLISRILFCRYLLKIIILLFHIWLCAYVMVVELETFPISLALLPSGVVSCTHAIMILLLSIMSAISLRFPVLLPMFAVTKRTCRYCVLGRFFIRSRLCCGSHSRTRTFGRGRGRSPSYEFVETMHVWQFTCFGVLLDDIQTRRYRGENTDGPIAHNIKTIWTDAN